MKNKLEELEKKIKKANEAYETAEKREQETGYRHYEILGALSSAELILEVAKEGHNNGDITDKNLCTVSTYAKAIKVVSAYAEDEYKKAREASFRTLLELSKNKLLKLSELRTELNKNKNNE